MPRDDQGIHRLEGHRRGAEPRAQELLAQVAVDPREPNDQGEFFDGGGCGDYAQGRGVGRQRERTLGQSREGTKPASHPHTKTVENLLQK